MSEVAKKLRELADAIEREQLKPRPIAWPPNYFEPPHTVRDDGMCDACRRGGICGCYRPERDSVWCGASPFGPETHINRR